MPIKPVTNPVEIINRTRRRLARLALLRTMLYVVAPLIVTLVIAFFLEVINALAFDNFGYLMLPDRALRLELGLVTLAIAEIVVVGFCAWRSRVAANDFVNTARRIDERIDGRQEILTLATLADPTNPDAARRRSPLFPMLWRRAISYLDMFQPRREFRLEARAPLARSSILGALAMVVLCGVTVAMMTVPTPAQAVAHRLRQLAKSLDASKAPADQRQLASAARDVAKDLDSSRLPPEQKLAELEALKRELEKFQAEHHGAQSGAANSSGGGNGSGKGGGSGKGSGGGQGSGAGQGSGSSGTGAGAGSGQRGKNKGDAQMIELRNDIAKAQLKLEQEAGAGDKSKMAQNGSQKGSGIAPQAGSDTNRPGGKNQPNGTGAFQLPQPGVLADNRMAAGENPGGHRNDKGTSGDTHLGEFPKGGGYERYYKLGEKGPGIGIRDARYVTFQLPSAAAASGAGGATVADTSRPTATTAYTNAPLKEERLPVTPDEQQLVPPRYRELIR
ncbi:MAG TPA: hypothetical protein VJN94_14760 [Candidatus Binataceae bacterium]|nr:hypothetical protein [Candidatus Binataceae bacterium]